MAVPPATVLVLANGDFPQVSRQSRLAANNKGDNEMKPGAMHRSPGIYLIAEENLAKPQIRELMKSSFQITLVGYQGMSGGRKGESGKAHESYKEREGEREKEK